MKRSPAVIIAFAAALYALAMTVVYLVNTHRADEKARTMLVQSETVFTDTISDCVDAALWQAGLGIVRLTGGTLTPKPLGEMRRIADAFCIDEVNFVDATGVCIGSNDPSVQGVSFLVDDRTRAFMEATNAAVARVSQPFRRGIANAGAYCKYFGLGRAAGIADGVLQVGFGMDRLVRMSAFDDPGSLRGWRIGVRGHFALYDEDGDGAGDWLPPDVPDGAIRLCRTPDGSAFCRAFTFAGKRYVSVIPVSEYRDQTILGFWISAAALAALCAFFAHILMRMSRAHAQLEAYHAAEDDARARDLATARTIQLSSLPLAKGAFPDQLEFGLEASSVPAKEVGGDFYDFYPVRGGRLAVVIADVSGKGVPAALFMMSAKNVLKACLSENEDLAAAVRKANEWLCVNNDAEMFVTAWVGLLDPATGEVEFVNAGHNRPFVRSADGGVARVDGRGGLFLGMFPEAAYTTRILALSPGDALFLYTDGVTEAMDRKRKLYGEKRLRDALARSASLDGIEADVHAFADGAEISDDRTVLALRYFGAPEVAEKTFPRTAGLPGEAMAFMQGEVRLDDRTAMARLLNAADEIVSNIANYSGAPDCTIRVERGADRCRITFMDGGREYNPLSHIDPDTTLPLADRPVGGLGILMAKKLVHDIRYVRRDGRNILSMVR